ncbi:helix-hairpin-helix domain-containing protein [Sedimentibacter sp. B4]|uniref:helix-hairpin-helix domain-containing protein n=1 Tax=Sedimentibacter sp. B4 TaxID=304766 RepID=UPI00059297C5|nr:helix-hairpin-helix domain-containing protein [Sedimentibacter sp. B4]
MNNSIYKKGLAVVLIIALIVMATLGIKLSVKENKIMYTSSPDMTNNDTNLDNAEEELSCIYVDIDGAVNNPGVYEFTEGDRVIDAIDKAGGLKDTAYTKNINKARKLVDGEKIYIFDEGEYTLQDLYNDGNEGKININTATKDNLMSLPGIGEVYAQRIIDYRNGKLFSSIEEIKEVQGIGDKIFEKIKDSITINN